MCWFLKVTIESDIAQQSIQLLWHGLLGNVVGERSILHLHSIHVRACRDCCHTGAYDPLLGVGHNMRPLLNVLSAVP